MKNTFKMAIIAFTAVIIICFAASCDKKAEPFSIDPSTLLFIGSEDDWIALGGDTSGLKPLQTPWTLTECANSDKLMDGEESCGRCPTCEGKTTVVMNEVPFTDSWQDFAFLLPPFPEGIKFLKMGQAPTYDRARIRVRYYWDDFIEMDPADSTVMVSLIYDPNGDWRGPGDSAGPNTPLKQFNVTNGPLPDQLTEDDMPFGSRDGASGISSNKGAMCMLEREPSIILFQTAFAAPSYIEVTEITFFKGEDE